MKKMIVFVFMLAAAATTMYAKEERTSTESATAIQEEAKVKIDPATLPDAVKTTLAGDTYKDWKVNGAWLVKADPVYYTIELKKDDKTNTVNIDANGKVK